MTLTGTFPLGAPAARCESRRVTDADLFVLGVYASAFHVAWQRPDGRRVRALAVGPEPYPFWCGEAEAERFDAFARSWQPTWGSISRVGDLNGSSGRAVRRDIVQPLDIEWARVWLTDAVPFFHVKSGRGSQGDAMANLYDEFAGRAGLPRHSLPKRPSASALVTHASTEERARLREELRESGVQHVVTLGNEALQVLARIADDAGDLPRSLSADSTYGRQRTIVVDHHRLAVIPLVHPGQRTSRWRNAHAAWAGASLAPL